MGKAQTPASSHSRSVRNDSRSKAGMTLAQGNELDLGVSY